MSASLLIPALQLCIVVFYLHEGKRESKNLLQITLALLLFIVVLLAHDSAMTPSVHSDGISE